MGPARGLVQLVNGQLKVGCKLLKAERGQVTINKEVLKCTSVYSTIYIRSLKVYVTTGLMFKIDIQ